MKTKMIIGTAILVMATSLLAGCGKKESGENASAPAGNGTSAYTGPCNMALDQNQQNRAHEAAGTAQELAEIVNAHGESGIIKAQSGDDLQKILTDWRSPTSSPSEACYRRAALAVYNKDLIDLKAKK